MRYIRIYIIIIIIIIIKHALSYFKLVVCYISEQYILFISDCCTDAFSIPTKNARNAEKEIWKETKEKSYLHLFSA